MYVRPSHFAPMGCFVVSLKDCLKCRLKWRGGAILIIFFGNGIAKFVFGNYMY